MSRVFKPPTPNPPFGKTPLKHGAKVQIVSLSSGKSVYMELNGALRANTTSTDYNLAGRFVVSQLGAAVMLQCPSTHLFIGASQGYLFGFRANESQAALRVFYHEDSGAIEFESCADPGKFLAFDRLGNVMPLNGKTEGVRRQFAVRVIEEQATAQGPAVSVSSLLSLGEKVVKKAIGGTATQLNFEKHKLRSVMINGGRIRLRSRVTCRYLAIMGNGIVHGNGDDTDILIVHHCFGLLRYAFQSEKYPNLWLCVTLDNITWAMVNKYKSTANKENPSMVWEVEKCRQDGTILLRRNTQVGNSAIHQYLGFAPNGKPTPTLIFPDEMGDMTIESAISNPQLHALQNPGVPAHPPAYGAASSGAGSAPPPDYNNMAAPSPIKAEPSYNIPPGALLYEGSIISMKNKLGYLSNVNGELQATSEKLESSQWQIISAGFMVFKFENSGKFMKAENGRIATGSDGPGTMFQVKFNPNGTVSFVSTSTENLYVGIKDPEITLEMS